MSLRATVWGADLIGRVVAKSRTTVTGVGGPLMVSAAGLTSLFPMAELSVMGWTDVLPRLPWLLWRVRQVANEITRTRPDVAVLVDAQVFSNLVAKRLRKAGYDRPVVLYVAPAVWGWKPERAAKIRPLYDEVLPGPAVRAARHGAAERTADDLCRPSCRLRNCGKGRVA